MTALLLSVVMTTVAPAAPPPFAIEVVDKQTGRGVPLITLKTVNELSFVTDSNGLVAFDEPGLVGQTVFFHVSGHGYEFPKDGFGYRGKALKVEPGGSARIEVNRLNIAERIYRVTGGGIYADTVRLGRPAPVHQPVLNGQVLGSDSVLNAVYRGRVYWFWGDTNKPSYPLGNFHVPGATSRLPSAGGLDPAKGVDLTYFVDDQGFAKPTCRMPGDGPTWISALTVVHDREGQERLHAAYVKIRPPLEAYEHGLVEFDDQAEAFRKVATFPEGAAFYPQGHPLTVREDGQDYILFAAPYPLTRVKANAEDLAHLERYEGFTCLERGTRFADRRIDRDAKGRARHAWKANTPALSSDEEAALVRRECSRPTRRSSLSAMRPPASRPRAWGLGFLERVSKALGHDHGRVRRHLVPGRSLVRRGRRADRPLGPCSQGRHSRSLQFLQSEATPDVRSRRRAEGSVRGHLHDHVLG